VKTITLDEAVTEMIILLGYAAVIQSIAKIIGDSALASLDYFRVSIRVLIVDLEVQSAVNFYEKHCDQSDENNKNEQSTHYSRLFPSRPVFNSNILPH
jgi:hypothetical protein